MSWLSEQGQWPKIKAQTVPVVEHLKSQGASKLGTAGFCWGASQALEAAGDGMFSAAACCHPAFFGE